MDSAFEELITMDGFECPQLEERFLEEGEKCRLLREQLLYLMYHGQRYLNQGNEAVQAVHNQLEAFDALISVSVEDFIMDKQRILFTIFNESVPYLITTYFSEIHFRIDGANYEWYRSIDSKPTDSIEILVDWSSNLIRMEIACFIDCPIQMFVVPESLQEIVGRQHDTLFHVLYMVNKYINEHGLIKEDILNCDDYLRQAFGTENIPVEQLRNYVASSLIPPPPLRLNFVLNQEKPRINYKIKLPSFGMIVQSFKRNLPSDVSEMMESLLEAKERADITAAVARNPVEAIQAEMACHVTDIDVTDDTSPEGLTISTEPVNAGKRSSLMFWQVWVNSHAQRLSKRTRRSTSDMRPNRAVGCLCRKSKFVPRNKLPFLTLILFRQFLRIRY